MLLSLLLCVYNVERRALVSVPSCLERLVLGFGHVPR